MKDMLLKAGERILEGLDWKRSAETPGYWIDPATGYVLQFQAALQQVKSTGKWPPNTKPETLEAAREMHHLSNKWRRRHPEFSEEN